VFAWDSKTTAVVGPPGALPFIPVAPAAGSDPALFSAFESLEFGGNQPKRAADAYRILAANSDARVQAAALLRLGRALRNAHDLRGALQAYERLAALADVRADDGVPAGLVGLDSQRLVLHQ